MWSKKRTLGIYMRLFITYIMATVGQHVSDHLGIQVFRKKSKGIWIATNNFYLTEQGLIVEPMHNQAIWSPSAGSKWQRNTCNTTCGNKGPLLWRFWDWSLSRERTIRKIWENNLNQVRVTLQSCHNASAEIIKVLQRVGEKLSSEQEFLG